MPKSISSAKNSSTAPSEWLLAFVTNPTRAAAILGDLTEMAATRDRLWFWTAYVRTLVTLGWRTPVAFICAIVGMRFIYRVVISWPMSWLMYHKGHAWIYAQIHPHVRGFHWILCMLMVQALFFALPFVLIRFGLRNRLTQLACALLLITLPIFILSPSPLMLDLFTIFSVLAIAVALLLPLWRRPLIVLAATCIPIVAMNPFFFLWMAYVFHKSIPLRYVYSVQAIYSISQMTAFTLAAIVCVYLYRRLLQRPLASDRTIA
jgi:hypothetical protein